MKRKTIILILAVGVSLGFLVAQERTITGKVTDAQDGSGMPGVNVTLKKTTTGAVTDVSGQYKNKVPESGGILVFSFIGYKSQEINIGISNVVNVKMNTDPTALNEVVVTGYGLAGKVGGAFGMLIRESEFIKDFTFNDVLIMAQGSRGDDKEGYRSEFINMVKSMGAVAKR